MVSNLVVEIAIYNFDLFHYTLTGNHFLNTPRDYMPHNMISGNTCVVCDMEFEVEDSLDEHIRSIHKVIVKKTFSKENSSI